MRLSINQTLASISKTGKGVTDMEICKWAQDMVKKSGKTSTMRSFKDPSLSNGVFFLDLLNAIKPGYVDYNLVNQGNGDEEKRQNGKSKPSNTRARSASVRDEHILETVLGES
jgi:plastin-1